MSQYHRHLDHDWQAARRETNYALFGNSAGRTVDSRGRSVGYEKYPKDAIYYAHCRANSRLIAVNRIAMRDEYDAGLSPEKKRAYDLAWLKLREETHD